MAKRSIEGAFLLQSIYPRGNRYAGLLWKNRAAPLAGKGWSIISTSMVSYDINLVT